MANTTAAIMALPAPLENIRLVGDEDKHATLLFFGETSTLPDGAKDVLSSSVQMAASMLFPFSESIRDVTRLGSDDPPALVAMLSDRCMSQVRNLFMMNPEVKGYLSNTQQFPSFTPHVTLAHPDIAEEIILRSLMNQLYRINFDRLAVWWNDERIEYALNTSLDVGEDSMAMSEAFENALAHQAIKLGEKKGKPGHILFIARGDKPKAGDQFQHKGVAHTVLSVSTSPNNPKRHMVTAKKTPVPKVEHSEWETYLIEDNEDADYFEHHGIKGQKWGVRRFVDKATGRVEMAGRTGLVPRGSSADQIAQDRIAKKIQKGGVKAVSNADIQAYTRRLQLQSDLQKTLATQTAAEKAKTDGFITRFVKRQANRQTNRIINAATDIAVEHALKQAGFKIKTKNPDLGENLGELSKRIKPKKK